VVVTAVNPSGPVVSSAPDSRVKIRNLSKSFPGTRALHNVNLDLSGGEIHALVGGNGSGKSTLIKVLSGIYQGDPGGTVEIDGIVTKADESTPATARNSRVHVVHQDLGVFLDLSVAENLALGSHYERTPLGSIGWRALARRTKLLIDRFEIEADPETELHSLGPAVRTQVAIARALQGDADSSRGLLILDEPTAALPAHEVEMLLGQLKRYAADGQAILYVSHRLDEILAVADRVSALRDGELVGTCKASKLDEASLIELIVGAEVERASKSATGTTSTNRIFSVAHLTANLIEDISFEVFEGEILGLAGLLGSGRTEILRAIFGDLQPASGEMWLGEERYRPRCTSDAIASGIAHVPEARVQDAIFPDETIAANIAMPALSGYFNKGRIRKSRIRRDTTSDISRFLIKANDSDDLISTLSGGNQQKVVVARWLRLKPRLLLLDEPTQGVDVGARAEIYRLVRDATDQGAGAVVVASDFEELAAVCDRILVIRGGRVVAELAGADMTPHRLSQITLKTGD
jgi:ribose transport system ATP-binding protein